MVKDGIVSQNSVEDVEPGPGLSQVDSENVYSSAVVAASFANLELVSVKKTLAETSKILSRVNAENVRLREEMNERDRDTLQVVEFLRKEVEKKHKLIEEGQQRYSALEDSYNQEKEHMNLSYANALHAKDLSLSEANTRIQELEDEMESIVQFKRQKQDIAEEIQELRHELVQTKERYEKELSRANFTALEERVRLKSEKKDFLDRFSQEVNARAMELLDDKTRSIYEQNRKLLVEKRELESETQSLNTHISESTAVLTEKMRELDLAQQSHRMIGKQGYRLRKELQQLTSRNSSLEDNIRKVAERYERELQHCEREHALQVTALKRELDDCKHAFSVQTKELRRMRALARTIVEQRSELECFFYEAITYAKKQKERTRFGLQGGAQLAPCVNSLMSHVDRKQHPGCMNSMNKKSKVKNDQTSLTQRLPRIESANPSMYVGTVFSCDQKQATQEGSTSLTTSGKLEDMSTDIAELTWEDKERILRMIFSKINAVTKPDVLKTNNPPDPDEDEVGLNEYEDCELLDASTPLSINEMANSPNSLRKQDNR